MSRRQRINGLWERDDGDSVFVERSPDAPLKTSPHYTDARFKRERTVYLAVGIAETALDQGSPIKGLHYNYDDRLWQWDYKKAEASVKVAEASGATPRSAKWYAAFMSAYRDKPTEVLHVLAGVNLSNGYPYYVLGYRDATK